MTGQERNYGFMKLSELTAYELLGEQELKDIHSMGYILRHKKSGARITVISNDDENKVFYIGFRTPLSTQCSADRTNIRSRIRSWNWSRDRSTHF